MRHSIAPILALTVATLAAHYALYTFLSLPFRWDLLWAYLYVVVAAFAFEYIFHRDHDPKMFINLYMGFSGGKMMLGLFVILVYGVLQKSYLWHFALAFMVLYFVFTAFEITRLLRHLKK